MYHAGGIAPIVLSTYRTNADVVVEETGNGSHVLKGVVIFRAGTFRDSRGIERTYTVEQLAAMASNFQILKDQNVLPNVPIRENHSIDVKDVVGYFAKVYVDPTDPNYLLADIEITEPDAFGKWSRGTYRSRSLEVGPYLKNGADKPIYPVIQGMAFVDLPAVEGLHRQEQAPNQHFSQFIEDGTPDPTTKEVTMNPQALAHLAEWIKNGGTADTWIAACNYAKQQDDQQAEFRRQQEVEQTFSSYCAAVQMHQQNAAALGLPTDYSTPYKFSIGGREVTDPAEVQRQLDTQASAMAEVAKHARQEFVKAAVAANKIPAPQEAATIALVDTFTPEQFSQYKATIEAQAPLAIFGQHGATGPQGGTGTGGADPAKPDEKQDLIDTIEQFRLMEKDDAFIKGTSAYKRLVALDPTQAIA